MFTILWLLFGEILLGLTSDSSLFDFLTIFIIIVGSAFFFLDIRLNRRLKKLRRPLIIGYIVRFFLLFYDVYSSDPLHLPLVGGSLSSDPLHFFNAASTLASGGRANYGGFFSQLFGVIFKFSGTSRLWGEYIVMMFSILTLLVIARIVLDLDVPLRDKKIGMYFACLMPNYLLLSVIFRRETFITFFVALSLLFLLQWVRGAKSERPFVLAVVFALLASLFHGATGLIVVFYIIIHFIYSPAQKKFVLHLRNILLVVAFSLVFLFVYVQYGAVFFAKLDRLDDIESLASVRDAGGSSYAQYVGNSSSVANILIYFIPRYVYFMYSPFPWQWRGLNDILTFLMSSVPYLLILIRSIKSIGKLPKGSDNRTILIVTLLVMLGITVVFSWGVTNTGTATRHRDKFIAIQMVLYVLSREHRLRLVANKNGKRHKKIARLDA